MKKLLDRVQLNVKLYESLNFLSRIGRTDIQELFAFEKHQSIIFFYLGSIFYTGLGAALQTLNWMFTPVHKQTIHLFGVLFFVYKRV